MDRSITQSMPRSDKADSSASTATSPMAMQMATPETEAMSLHRPRSPAHRWLVGGLDRDYLFTAFSPPLAAQPLGPPPPPRRLRRIPLLQARRAHRQ